MQNTERQRNLISKIIDKELKMFQAVKNRGEVASCQKQPAAFRLMRFMTHAVQTVEFLESYLNDLNLAIADGRNFMTEKYALMEGLIPPLNTEPCIDEITRIECAWQEEMDKKYPELVQKENNNIFWLYLRSELQTLSSQTLNLYYNNINQALKEGRNLVVERYEILMNNLDTKK